MSSKTENLELFKYDPVADKDQTFNIELALNQNWDKVDKEIAQREGLLRSSAVKEGVSDTDAIAIVDDADSSKTKRVLWSTIKSTLSNLFVPSTRKINNKDLSSDVTLTGADINVSGSDETKIDAALSNKADKTQPQEYSLPLADGFSNGGGGHSTYWKDQFGQVHVIINVKTPQITTNQGYIVATLPVGYRPMLAYLMDASGLLNGNTRIGGSTFNFNQNGVIRYFGPQCSQDDVLWGEAIFLAEH